MCNICSNRRTLAPLTGNALALMRAIESRSLRAVPAELR